MDLKNTNSEETIKTTVFIVRNRFGYTKKIFGSEYEFGIDDYQIINTF